MLQRTLIGIVVFAFTSACGFLTGCSEQHMARTGTVYEGDLGVGSYAPDFSFVGQDGQVETFSSVRKVVTLVVFPDMPDWPSCSRCDAIVEVADRAGTMNSPVAVVSVVCPPEGKKAMAALYRCNIRGESPLIALNDHRGRVRALYGRGAIGKFHVVGADGRISAVGKIDDVAGMEDALKAAVGQHDKYWQDVNDF